MAQKQTMSVGRTIGNSLASPGALTKAVGWSVKNFNKIRSGKAK